MNSDAYLGGLKRQMVVGAALAVVGPLAGVTGIAVGLTQAFAKLDAEARAKHQDPAKASAPVGNIVSPGLCGILGGAACVVAYSPKENQSLLLSLEDRCSSVRHF